VSVIVVPVPLDVTVPGYRVSIQTPVVGKPFSTTLPVDNAQVGAVIVPTRGDDGITGWAVIKILADGGEMHPIELVTAKVYVPSGRFEMIIPVPDPVVVILPGARVNVHVPVEGNPDNVALPVDTVHVGWPIDVTTGAVGVDAGAIKTTGADAIETHPDAATVKVYVPAERPVIVVLVPVPVVVIPPGLCVIVHVSIPGREFKTTLPAGTEQAG
jgi:hypothetical protein